MRVLITSPFALEPPVSGGATRTIAIARGLAQLDHVVRVLSPDRRRPNALPAPIVWTGYRQRSRVGYFVNVSFARALSRELARGVDLAILEYPYQAAMVLPLLIRTGARSVYDAHNVEQDRFRQTGQRVLAAPIGVLEHLLCRSATAVLTVSEPDRRLLRACHGRDAIVLPNGVDTERFTPGPPAPELLQRYGLVGRDTVLFFGSFTYHPNVDALRFLLDAWPAVRARRPDARLLVVGREPPNWAKGREGVVTRGVVDDIVSHIRLASVVAVPLASGGGTRLKVLESLACAQTVLSTPFGARGIVDRDGPALRLAPLGSFTERLHDLLERPPAPGSNHAARALALRYRWSDLVAGVDWEALAGTALPPPG